MPTRYPSAFSQRMYRGSLAESGNVLEIPSIYTAPTRGDIVNQADPSCCPCTGSGPQGPGRTSGPQNPYAMPGPQGLGVPTQPQKPFQPPSQDPCAMNDEILRGLGLDPDCLRGSMRRSAPKSRAKSPSRGRNNPKARSSRAKQKTGSSRKKRKGTLHTVKKNPSNGARYRKLSNGACYDTSTRRFVKKANC